MGIEVKVKSGTLDVNTASEGFVIVQNRVPNLRVDREFGTYWCADCGQSFWLCLCDLCVVEKAEDPKEGGGS